MLETMLRCNLCLSGCEGKQGNGWHHHIIYRSIAPPIHPAVSVDDVIQISGENRLPSTHAHMAAKNTVFVATDDIRRVSFNCHARLR